MSYTVQDAHIEIQSMMEEAEKTHSPELAWYLSDLLVESDEELAFEWRMKARQYQWEIDRYDNEKGN